MSDADKIFEELGYELHSSKSRDRFELYSLDNEHLIKIIFNKITKRIEIHCECEALDMQELKAINMKVLELGWSVE